MDIFSGPNSASALLREKTKTTLSDIYGTDAKPEVTDQLARVRKEKVLAIRQQLAVGKYDLGERLDFALDKLIEDIITEESPEARKKRIVPSEQIKSEF